MIETLFSLWYIISSTEFGCFQTSAVLHVHLFKAKATQGHMVSQELSPGTRLAASFWLLQTIGTTTREHCTSLCTRDTELPFSDVDEMFTNPLTIEEIF